MENKSEIDSWRYKWKKKNIYKKKIDARKILAEILNRKLSVE